MVLSIWRGHKLPHDMTAELFWHVQNYDVIGSPFFILKLLEFVEDFNFELMNLYLNGTLVWQH